MVQSEEILNSPGDYNMEELTITSAAGEVFDVSNFLLELHIYEDVFSPCMTGKLVIADAINLISSIPILGNEILTIKIRTPTLEDTPFNLIEKSFQIYSIDDRTLTSDRSQYYTISFISKEGYYDSVIPITKTFRGKTDKIVSSIYENYIKAPRRADNEEKFTNLVINDTPHQSNLTYTSNFWPPFKNLNFVSKRVRGAQLQGADYLFFESNKNFYFSSMEAMINDQLSSGIFEDYVIELDGMTIPRRENGLQYYGNLFKDSMTKIEKFKMTKTLNALEGQTSGYFSSTVLGYDLITKKMSETSFNYIDNNDAFIKTDVGTPIPADIMESSYANSEFVMFNTSVFNDYGKTANKELPEGHPAQLYSDRHLYRKSYLNSFDQFRFEMVIPGRTDIEVGTLINIFHPNPSVIDESDIDTIIDPILSGMYLITAIHHKFDDNRHVITAEVVKNGIRGSLGEK